MTAFIFPRIWRRPSRACRRAESMISRLTPPILMSIWMAVTPFFVPATLKSMSPRWSSSPRMSERTATASPSLMSPIAMPETAPEVGIPASIIARDEPHTVAIEEDPLDSRTPAPPLAAGGGAQHLHLSHAEGREIVVEHERLGGVPQDRVDPLLVLRRPEGRRDKGLRLAAGEDGGAGGGGGGPHLAG